MLAELIGELVFQVLAELLGHLGVRFLETRVGRLVFSAVAGFAGGFAWGAVLSGRGHDGTPRTVWVALALAVGSAGAAFALRQGIDGDVEPGFLPWRWSPGQWEAFALLNAFVALGVTVGL